ncbi:universal stress protein [Prosthecobacter vanneervenii]|uniref:Nucleotide-binding universal stress UspA family protein n=1 Tax=Prosthecobacter vanneervenii TaxID=48466 RepID=A0A7W7YF47_9BACT|nr:universal stress protein [Prosthecobacter vanneervenii]MBB5035066.1 nucleotide-binding universal stress UspA family protein [Prosthecobacter vanneervenii]
MKKLHHVIAAIDFTDCCRAALREAARRASLDGAAITVVHVMDEFLVHELKNALATDQATVRADWLERLKKFVADAEVSSAVNAEVRIGTPFTELVEACRAHSADLLVMGAKGSRNEPHRIGVIAAKCVRKAPVDVLVVREDAQGPFKKIVACVDFSENSAKAVQCALHVAQQDSGELDCLHVFQSALAMSLDYGGFAPSLPATYDPQAVDNWRKELAAFLEPLTREGEGVSVAQHVTERVNIREAILDHVSETHASLVVLGTSGKTGLREMLIGTTAEKIVQHVPCSILAVKPDGFVISPD